MVSDGNMLNGQYQYELQPYCRTLMMFEKKKKAYYVRKKSGGMSVNNHHPFSSLQPG